MMNKSNNVYKIHIIRNRKAVLSDAIHYIYRNLFINIGISIAVWFGDGASPEKSERSGGGGV